ncbi:MAG: glucose-6-phosphate dehydrogenase assembly protein OpcA [Bryobacterales bacterium]|nr:glucose-6-phosphate dehydrogenase assembly protein OpcA [Bryobacterales bacterium]
MEVDAGRLLKELDENWRQLGKGEGSGVLRACAMTLIVLVREGADAQELGVTLADIMHEHPNRTIVLRVGEVGEVVARANLQCWMPFGGRQQICCEQIEISASLETLGAVPPVLFGLMVADLPVAVWCPDLELADLPELRPVLKLASKVMVDSSATLDIREALPALQRLSTESWRLADLAWARATRWRETVAQLACTEGWSKADEAEITWAGEGIPPAAAYVGAWINPGRLVMKCDTPEMPAAGVGRIKSVCVTAKGRQVCLRREGTGVAIEIERLRTGMVFPLLTDAALLHEELGVFGQDSQYERALAGVQGVLDAGV